MARCVFQIISTLIHLWLFILITSNGLGNETDCIPYILVPRNTVWKTCVTSQLKINCTVESESHCWEKIKDISWCKIDDKNVCRPLIHSDNITTEWKHITENKGMWFLIFHNISIQDAGLYRCEIKSPTPTVSHNINVTVTDFPDCKPDYGDVNSKENSTTNDSKQSVENDELLFYVYIGCGIGVLLLIVGFVSVVVICCRGKKRSIKTAIHEIPVQYSTATPLPPIHNHRESPRNKTQTLPANLGASQLSCTYDIPPVRVTSLRDRSTTGRHPVNRELPKRSHGRGRVEVEEDENPLIYATLNHEAGPQRPVRVARVQIEESEYAAIKVT